MENQEICRYLQISYVGTPTEVSTYLPTNQLHNFANTIKTPRYSGTERDLFIIFTR